MRLRCGGDHWKAQPTDRSLRIYIQSGSKPSGERKNPIFAATHLGKTRNSLMSDQADTNEMLVSLTAIIVAAHVHYNIVALAELYILLNNVQAALSLLGNEPSRAYNWVPAATLYSPLEPGSNNKHK